VEIWVEAPRGESLEPIFGEVDSLEWAAQFADPELKLVWVSKELTRLLGTDDPEKLGYGRHVIQVYLSDIWQRTITEQSAIDSFVREMPFYLYATPGGKESIREMFEERWRDSVDKFEPAEPPPVWAGYMRYLQGDLPPVRVHHLTTQIHDNDGELLGYLRVYGPGLRAGLAALVARGSSVLFERMARIHSPGRRRAAILFADLQSSSHLSRKLSSAAYFSLLQRLFTAIDELIVDDGGIVGKHAGDGVTGFFLTEDAGSDSAAARTAIYTACRIAEVADEAARETEGLVESGECLFNIGVHWGGALYMGQVVTGGRIEVTALGDEVNEGARVQQSAKEGQVLATKDLIERLTPEDAEALGMDPDRLVYTTLSELPEATEKARRDAGGIAVVDVGAARSKP
jgi:class 3 adenylate cyclase